MAFKSCNKNKKLRITVICEQVLLILGITEKLATLDCSDKYNSKPFCEISDFRCPVLPNKTQNLQNLVQMFLVFVDSKKGEDILCLRNTATIYMCSVITRFNIVCISLSNVT